MWKENLSWTDNKVCLLGFPSCWFLLKASMVCLLAKISGWHKWGWKEVFICMCASFWVPLLSLLCFVQYQNYIYLTHVWEVRNSDLPASALWLFITLQASKNQMKQKSGKELRRVRRALWCFPSSSQPFLWLCAGPFSPGLSALKRSCDWSYALIHHIQL